MMMRNTKHVLIGVRTFGVHFRRGLTTFFGKFDFVKLGYEMQHFSTTLEGRILEVFKRCTFHHGLWNVQPGPVHAI